MADETVWRGSPALEQFLVPLGELAPFPGNSRRGDVTKIREGLAEFGQVRPILVEAERVDGKIRIVAGHHVTLAAGELGWTHVGAVPNPFESEEQARRFLLFDNRSHDVGSYDIAELHSQLMALRETPRALEATGYESDYVDRLGRELERARQAAELQAPPSFPTIDPNDMHVDYICPSCKYGWSGSPRPGS